MSMFDVKHIGTEEAEMEELKPIDAWNNYKFEERGGEFLFVRPNAMSFYRDAKNEPLWYRHQVATYLEIKDGSL